MRFSRLALLLAIAAPVAVQAQTPAMPAGQEDMMKMMHLAAHNQLGVLEYCQTEGSVGAETVALQKRLLGFLPPAKVDGIAEAEAAGKRGVVVFNGTEVKLADAAKQQSTTPDAMCKQMAEMLKSQAAMMPK